ncbi:MAG: hypothetical protein RSB39_07110 [Oscillospiraceae bacterium]
MKFKGVTLWQKSDLDGFFGLFTNNVTNILVLTGLLLYTVKLPSEMVFGRILPGVGVGILLSSICYSILAYRLAKKEGRSDVTALPSGISVTHMFLVVFMIILPVNVKTGDPELAWKAALAWCFIEGVIECSGAAIGKIIRKIIPRAALLGSLAGVSITYIMANGAIQAWEVSYIAFASFAVILLGFFAKKKMPFGLPTGLVAIALGTILGWVSGYMSPEALSNSLGTVGVYAPKFAAGSIFEGFREAAPFLISAIPMGIYNFIESIDNLESASVAGDHYNTTTVLLCDGLTSIVGCMFGSPMPTAVYIGHPGWKSIGARVGYALATGVAIFVICIFGLESVLINIIPVAALLPILVYIGMLIGSQAFQNVPKSHMPAVILAFLPWLADWAKTIIGNTLTAAGIPGGLPVAAFEGSGVYYSGILTLGSGAMLIGIIWASLLIFMQERKQKSVIVLSLIAAAMSFFGIIHSPAAGICMAPEAAIGYCIIAVITLLLYKRGYEDDSALSIEEKTKE